MTAPAELRRIRWQRAARAVHMLGPRALYELLDEIARYHPEIAGDLDQRLRAYAERLSPELLRAVGADRFAPQPLRLVSSGRR